jgi:hypothetical protein
MSGYNSPVFSIAGAMPGDSEMSHWDTANINPDAAFATPNGQRHHQRGPSFSMAGAMPGGSSVKHWDTPFPTGEAIYVNALREAERRELVEGAGATVLPFRTRARRRLPRPAAKAA